MISDESLLWEQECQVFFILYWLGNFVDIVVWLIVDWLDKVSSYNNNFMIKTHKLQIKFTLLQFISNTTPYSWGE